MKRISIIGKLEEILTPAQVEAVKKELGDKYEIKKVYGGIMVDIEIVEKKPS